MRTSTLYRVTSMALLLTVTACSNADFESVTEITKPRILDIQETPVGVAENETMTIEPVVAFPQGFTDALHFSYTLCLFDSGPNHYYACVEDLPIPFENILASGEGDTFSFEQSLLSNEELHDICDILAGESDTVELPPEALEALPTCSVGLPFQIRVKMCVGSSDCADEDAVIVRKESQLIFDETAARSDRNANPVIDGLSFEGEGLSESAPHPVSLGDKKEDFELLLDADLDVSAQEYAPVDADEDTPTLREELETRWFASTEGISSTRRFYREGKTRDDEFKENEITLDPDVLEDGEIVDLWVILRDSRLGSDVIHRQILIEKQ